MGPEILPFVIMGLFWGTFIGAIVTQMSPPPRNWNLYLGLAMICTLLYLIYVTLMEILTLLRAA